MNNSNNHGNKLIPTANEITYLHDLTDIPTDVLSIINEYIPHRLYAINNEFINIVRRSQLNRIDIEYDIYKNDIDNGIADQSIIDEYNIIMNDIHSGQYRNYDWAIISSDILDEIKGMPLCL